MNQKFLGWDKVAGHLRAMADRSTNSTSLINDGQRASLLAIADRIGRNGVILADEVGMGKTRIAVFVANAVKQCAGRVAVVIPPGLGFQWAREFHNCGSDVPPVIRSLQGYFEAWNGSGPPWSEQPVVMISHRFSNWRFGENTQSWRWCLLPELYAAACRSRGERTPKGYRNAYERDRNVNQVAHAACSIVKAVKENNDDPARRRLSDLESLAFRDLLSPQDYGANTVIREKLENAVGLGLGAFDLIIIDEAHKNRKPEGSLSTVLEKIILKGRNSRCLALTATPIELSDKQWDNMLARMDATTEQRALVTTAAQQYVEAIQHLQSGWRTNSEVREAYRKAAGQFQSTLCPYLLRRDKREDADVRAFVRASGESEYSYRQLREIAIDLNDLDPVWLQVICAAEALSVVREESMKNAKTQRLRLTVGNGHGLTGIIDEAFRDEAKDEKQIEEDQQQDREDGMDLAPNEERPISCRSAWWLSLLKKMLPQGKDDSEILFCHPAIQAAVRAIEEETDRGEKVLVFGRFTHPMRVLVNLLNARQMLKSIEQGIPWPQSKVHEAEWPAVYAAHKQLKSKVNLAELNDLLSKRYNHEISQRPVQRENLLSRIRNGLPMDIAGGRSLAILDAVVRQTTANDSGDNVHDLTLLARAMSENTDLSNSSDAELAKVFLGLVEAAADRDGVDEDGADEEQAHDIWETLRKHLKEDYSGQRGGFARLMYGETRPEARRMLQFAFNRPNSFPRVLVAQSLVGREGLNLHESCRIVVLLHPEWNPGVVEQQIGRVDRVNSRWAKELHQAIADGKKGADLPRIEIRPIIFKGTYDEHNWNVLQKRWDDLRAQLHGDVLSAHVREAESARGHEAFDEITEARPNFSPCIKHP
ncbi:hypothetical protein JCM25156A_11920 [Komagataeibacter kakiaceti JCM 25156]|uniref:helicase-related protein n=1 Tax=Komagataeibacter kakiaceti TaxID=943261 RepID=UPI000A8F33DA|nr:helicase-related protein [Komagataeibacter kakiaceti]